MNKKLISIKNREYQIGSVKMKKDLFISSEMLIHFTKSIKRIDSSAFFGEFKSVRVKPTKDFTVIDHEKRQIIRYVIIDSKEDLNVFLYAFSKEDLTSPLVELNQSNSHKAKTNQ